KIAGWPGSYPGTYPMSHQIGWGWINGQNQLVGDSAHQNLPGPNGYPSDGFQQALEPMYLFNNTKAGNMFVAIKHGDVDECRSMIYSNTSKSLGTALTTPTGAYANAGEEAIVLFADLVGGSAPSITSTPSCSWQPLQGGANSGMRLTGWHCTVT